MRIDEIRIDGFGTLSQLQISQLNGQLNVIHGANGSGKTTVLQFLRGMFAGFGEARRLRLLPPLKGGTSGGNLAVQTASGRFEIIRQGRADHSDTLAINLLRGSGDDAADLRQQLRSIPVGVLTSVFFVSGPEAHDLPLLVRTALADGVCLTSTRRTADSLHSRMSRIEQERSDLFQGTPSRGSLAELEDRRVRIESDLLQARQQQAAQLDQWRLTVRLIEDRLAQLQQEAAWTLCELQSVEADLTEVQTRLWSQTVLTQQQIETVERPAVVEPAAWAVELQAIDREIAHAQQVLRDLAGSRMKLSLEQAGLTGADAPDLELAGQRQRDALARIEKQTELVLRSATSTPLLAAACRCGESQAELVSSMHTIREQLWLICQELSRQQAAHEQWLCQSQREGVDRCELELTRQIQRLRVRRDRLLHDPRRTHRDRLQFRHPLETERCDCQDHDHFIADLPEPVVTIHRGAQVIAREKTVVTSSARPGDGILESDLLARQRQLRSQWWDALDRQRATQDELQALLANRNRLSEDPSVQALRYEYACVEQQLADGREQWQSLAMLQEILQRTREKLVVEVASPVVQDASDMLRRMTDGRYLRFVFDPQIEELRVVNTTNAELPLTALSRGTLEQAALCFRLALCREYGRRGLDLPLILDDVLADSDEERLRAAVEVLMEFASERQVLVFTCQDHLMSELERRGVMIQDLPGSRRSAAAAPHFANRVREFPVAAPAAALDADAPRPLDRVQPDEPFWLQAESPVSYVPSLGEQMSRRLGALGVRTVGDLIDLDPETTEIPLPGLQISSTTLRNWQAEARLLCCVPQLTGRDAQVLVLCGIQNPSELAEADIATLHSRIRRLHDDRAGEHHLSWLTSRPDWPSREAVQAWVRQGRAARRWRRARDVSPQRRMRLRHAGPSRDRSGERTTLTVRPVERHAVAVREELPRVAREWTWHLARQSEIVDAPSIGPRTAQRFSAIGIENVDQFLARRPDEIAVALDHRTLTAEVIREWQQQADLMCRVPELRGHDVQMLVACGITTPDAICQHTPSQLLALVLPFAESKAGQRVLRSAKLPDLEEVVEWIESAHHAMKVRAA